MQDKLALAMPGPPRVFGKETVNAGKPARIQCVDVGGQTYTIDRGLVTIVRLEDEWYEDVADPASVVAALRSAEDMKADIFTFWQRVPDVEPRYDFYREWEELAVLPVESYDDWWKNRIKSRTRGLIRKSEKEGVVVRETSYDDDFVRGMTRIFNESPVRQGRPFWHYGKDFETIKRQFSRFVFREQMIGAYHGDEMVGFVMLGNAGRFGVTGQIISALKHRDKAVSNLLIAKSVQVCERKQLAHLVYLFWGDGSLSEFKRRCGFEKTRVPRYFVPLTAKGAIALKIGAHRGWRAMVPPRIRTPLLRLRASWYGSSAD